MSDQVADRIALQDVMLRYAAGVDERDFDLYASCFIEDVEILDFGEEPIKGTFYSEELQKVIEPETFDIEKVIRKKKNLDGSVSCLVKWKGYPEKFNSYVLEKDLKKK